MNFAFIWIAISRLILHGMAFPQFYAISHGISIIILIGTIIGNFSVIIAAIVAEDRFFKIHYAAGSMFFVGTGIPGILYILFHLIRLILGNPWPSLASGLILLIIMASYGLWLLSQLIMNKQPTNKRYDLEWYLFFLLEIWQACYFIPLALN